MKIFYCKHEYAPGFMAIEADTAQSAAEIFAGWVGNKLPVLVKDGEIISRFFINVIYSASPA